MIDPTGEAAVLVGCVDPQAVGCAAVIGGAAAVGCVSSPSCRGSVADATRQVIDYITERPDGIVFPGRVPSDVLPSTIPGPQVTPLPGETIEEFTERVTQTCKQTCIDQAVEEVENGEDEMPPVGGDIGDKIGRCTHACIDEVLEEVDDE